jgi:hypothetical protein
MHALPPSRVRTVGAVLLTAALVSAGAASAQGGLFEFLHFGGGAETPPSAAEAAPSNTYRPLEMRVRPRRSARRAAPRRSETAQRDMITRQKEDYAKLNPATNPDWYLQDPTLRPGDLVVLKSGIMMFAGEREAAHMPSDFRPLDEDRTLSKADRQNLGKIAIAD